MGRGGQTARRARPLARREASTFRPPTVFMRARKPCVRARRIFEGWNVRFMGGNRKEFELRPRLLAKRISAATAEKLLIRAPWLLSVNAGRKLLRY